MSAFITRIPVPVDLLKADLPPDTDFESITFNEKTHELELRWSNRTLVTPFSFHLDFPRDLLQAKQLPAGVTKRERVAAVAQPAAGKVVDKVLHRRVRKGS